MWEDKVKYYLTKKVFKVCIVFFFIMAAIVNEVTLENGHRLPDSRTLQNIIKLAVVEDKPIMMDYLVDSLEKKVIIGVRGEGKEAKKMLIKN